MCVRAWAVRILVHHKSRPPCSIICLCAIKRSQTRGKHFMRSREREKTERESNDDMTETSRSLFPFGTLTKYVVTVRSLHWICVFYNSYKWMMEQMRFGAIFSELIYWEKLMMKPGIPGTVLVYSFWMNINKEYQGVRLEGGIMS